MKNIPEKIYLQIGADFKPDEDDTFTELVEVTWADHRINENDLEYKFVPVPTKEKFKDKIGRIVTIVICVIAFASLIYYMGRDHVEQEVYKTRDGDYSFVTWIYKDGHVIKGVFDPLTITDSLKNARLIEAEKILSTLK